MSHTNSKKFAPVSKGFQIWNHIICRLCTKYRLRQSIVLWNHQILVFGYNPWNGCAIFTFCPIKCTKPGLMSKHWIVWMPNCWIAAKKVHAKCGLNPILSNWTGNSCQLKIVTVYAKKLMPIENCDPLSINQPFSAKCSFSVRAKIGHNLSILCCYNYYFIVTTMTLIKRGSKVPPTRYSIHVHHKGCCKNAVNYTRSVLA